MAASFSSGQSSEEVNREKEDLDLMLRLPKAATPVRFFDLPRELQLHVFSFFSHEDLGKIVAPVCQDWWKLSKDPSLRKSLSIYVRREDETKKWADLLTEHPMLTKLKITTSFSLREFAACARACPMLVHLDLGGCQHLDYRILTLFVKYCPLIEELNVAGCKKVEKECMHDIVRLKNLRLLNLSQCHLVDDDCFELITDNCRQLEDLNIAGVTRITDKAIRNLGEQCSDTVLRLVLDGRGLRDWAFRGLSLCTKLQHLWICYGDLLTDQTLGYLKMLTGLKSLTLIHAWPNKLTTNTVNNYFAGSHVCNLVKLELSESTIDDDGVYNMTQNCKLLKSLSLSQCYKVTELGLEHIVKHCDILCYLVLSGLPLLTGHCLSSVPENLSCLEYLNLEYCKRVVESRLVNLANRVPKLRLFNANGELVVPSPLRDGCDQVRGKC